MTAPLDSSDLHYPETCAVCPLPGSKTCGACESVYYCSRKHQKVHWRKCHRYDCSKYETRNFEGIGCCMVATRGIQPGLLIASEYPLAVIKDLPLSDGRKEGNPLERLFPLSSAMAFPCPSCGGNIFHGVFSHRCRKCGVVPLCKVECEGAGLHAMECRRFQEVGLKTASPDPLTSSTLSLDLAILRLYLKEEEKGRPISFENPRWRSLLQIIFSEKLAGGDKQKKDSTSAASTGVNESILNSIDAAEKLPLSLGVIKNKELVILLHCAVTSYGIGFPYDESRSTTYLFTKHHRLSHSCVPNAEFWLEDKNSKKLMIKAVRPIPAGERITVNKLESHSLLPTIQRRAALQQICNINCNCRRCRDPTELTTFLCSIRCEDNLSSSGCSGRYHPANPLSSKTKWKCSGQGCGKPFKTHLEMKNLVRSLEDELPSVGNGRLDEVIRKLQDFHDFYAGDVLSSGHYLVVICKSRIRQVLKKFLMGGTGGEMLILAVVCDLPRSYEYCITLHSSMDILWNVAEKLYPTHSMVRAHLLYEIAICDLAIALHDHLVLKKLSLQALLRNLHQIYTSLKRATLASSIYTHPPGTALKENINFMKVFVMKLKTGGDEEEDDEVAGDYEKISRKLSELHSHWGVSCKRVGLAGLYMEPKGGEGDAGRGGSGEDMNLKHTLRGILQGE